MRVLGIDPGYAIVGWGVVDYAGNRFAPVDFGAVCTDAGVPFERRLDEVYAGVKAMAYSRVVLPPPPTRETICPFSARNGSSFSFSISLYCLAATAIAICSGVMGSS